MVGDCVGADGGDGLAEGALVDEGFDVDVEVGQGWDDVVWLGGHGGPDVADVGGGAGGGQLAGLDVAHGLEGLGGGDVGPVEEGGPRLVGDGDVVAAGDEVEQLCAEEDVGHGAKGLDDGVEEARRGRQGGVWWDIAAAGDLNVCWGGAVLGDDDAVVVFQNHLFDRVEGAGPGKGDHGGA